MDPSSLTNTSTAGSGFSSRDWIGIIMASNEAALRWVSAFKGTPTTPTNPVVTVSSGGLSVGQNVGPWLLLGALAVVAYLILRR